MLHRSSRFALAVLFLAALLVAGGSISPAHAAGEATYIEDVVHSADIDHITTLIDNALTHLDGLQLDDHGIVYDALGRTNTALDLLYSSGATGDVFDTAEQVLLTQRDLLQEVEHATLTGNLADLSTVTPLLVDYAQARLAFERQTTLTHSGRLPLSGSHLGSSFLHDRSLLGSRSLIPSRSLSTPYYPSRSLSTPYYPGRSLSTPYYPSRSLSTPYYPGRSLSTPYYPSRSLSTPYYPSRSLSTPYYPSRSLSTLHPRGRSLYYPGSSFLTRRHSRLSGSFGHRSLLFGRGFSRYGFYR
jgi:hypothetical protein